MDEELVLWDQGDAWDWLDELMSRRGEAPLRRALTRCLKVQGYLDAAEGGPAVAACLVLAAWRGNAVAGTPPFVTEWVWRQREKPSAELVETAVRAVERVRNNSEIADLWDEGGHGEYFLSALTGISEALKAGERALDPATKPIKFRPKLGDVLQIPLPDGRYAYGRIYRERSLRVYRQFSEHPNQPPIGSREFLFFKRVSRFELPGGGFPEVVGRDPFAKGEASDPPLGFDQTGPVFSVWVDGKEEEWTAEDCRGMERIGAYFMHTVIDRIMWGEEDPRIGCHIWPVYRDPVEGPIAIPWRLWPRPE